MYYMCVVHVWHVTCITHVLYMHGMLHVLHVCCTCVACYIYYMCVVHVQQVAQQLVPVAHHHRRQASVSRHRHDAHSDARQPLQARVAVRAEKSLHNLQQRRDIDRLMFDG